MIVLLLVVLWKILERKKVVKSFDFDRLKITRMSYDCITAVLFGMKIRDCKALRKDIKLKINKFRKKLR